jgi:uncharacterized membrane protein
MSENNRGRTITIVAYILHLLGAITGLASIVGLIINYVKRGEDGPLMDSHHNWMIRSFWYALLACFICFILVFTVIGIPLAWLGFLATWVWYIYRHIRGLIDLADDKSMSAESLF